MKRKERKSNAIISFLPLISFIIWGIYFLIVSREEIAAGRFQDHISVVTSIFQNWNGMLALFILSHLITAAVLIYYVVHLARLRNMHGGNKAVWMLFLFFFAPISIPFFWYSVIRNESDHVETYHSIA
jgi:hypothetical protein